MYPYGYANAVIHLKNGKKININSKATARKERPDLLNKQVYDELIEKLEKNIKTT
jgi:hypothetical protein